MLCFCLGPLHTTLDPMTAPGSVDKRTATPTGAGHCSFASYMVRMILILGG
jgi:hypothetical protein